MPVPSIYKTYNISQRRNIATSGEKEIVDAITYEFGCIPGAPIGGCIPPVIHNVMGQEDKYREDPVNVRVLNSGQARVVFTTEYEGSSIIYCDPDPGAGVAPTTVVVNDATLEIYHEKFWTGLALDTLYKFYVRSINACGDEISGYYYLLTGSSLDFDLDTLTIVISDELITIDVSDTIELSFTDEVVQVGQELIAAMSVDTSNSVQAPDLDEISLFDETFMYTTTVVI